MQILNTFFLQNRQNSTVLFIYYIYLTHILLSKLTENTFSFTTTTWWRIARERGGDEWVNGKLLVISWPWWYEGQIVNFSQDTGVNTPTHKISATGSFVITESEDFLLTSHPKAAPYTGQCPFHCKGAVSTVSAIFSNTNMHLASQWGTMCNSLFKLCHPL